MKNLQDFINRYNKIAQNLGYSGESVEVLVQLLANASYVSEVEDITYLQESSLEKCTLPNSKIQHCMDNMYSVFRGSCPRVIMKIKPTTYLTLKPFDLIQESSNFSVYYLGYYKLMDYKTDINRGDLLSQGNIIDSSNNAGSINISGPSIVDFTNLSGLDDLETDQINSGFIYSGITFKPSIADESYIIICMLSPKSHTIEKTIDSRNTYYIDCPIDNLSNDVSVSINDQQVGVTRNFADHILKPMEYVFDLTLPSFGSRIYTANYFSNQEKLDRSDVLGTLANTKIKATFFEWSVLEDYNKSELKRLSYRGAELLPFNSEWLRLKLLTESDSGSGICFVKEVERDNLNTIHYKSARDRYVGSIIRSNSDIGTLLEEDFPEYIKTGGTSYVFSTTGSINSSLTIYYIPKNESKLIPLVSEDPSNKINSIQDFIDNKRAYYIITRDINVEKGSRYTVNFNISLELYRNSNEDLNNEIGKILKSTYERKFNIVFNQDVISEVRSLVSKFSNVKKINSLSITFLDNRGREVSNLDYNAMTSYFDVNYSISTLVSNTPSQY